jgi:hypothetical protein
MKLLSNKSFVSARVCLVWRLWQENSGIECPRNGLVLQKMKTPEKALAMLCQSFGNALAGKLGHW